MSTPLTYEEWQEMQNYDREHCKHENADHLMPGQFTMFDDGALWTATAECFRCVDCKTWLSLGPSNDASPNVAIEMAAWCGDVELRAAIATLAHNLATSGALCRAFDLGRAWECAFRLGPGHKNKRLAFANERTWHPGCGKAAP